MVASFVSAKWIAGYGRIMERGYGQLSPALMFAKKFYIDRVTIREAEILVSGIGCHEVFLNGHKVHDDVLSPQFTAYDKRVLFCRYDLKNFIKQGENIIAVRVGNGFYNQPTEDTWGFWCAAWRDNPKLIAEIFVNEESVCATDGSWRMNLHDPCIHNAVRTGEYYDARKETDWEGEFESWEQAAEVNGPGGLLQEQEAEPIRIIRRLHAKRIIKSAAGWIYDFGENISGFCELSMNGEAGQTVRIRYAEKLHGAELDMSNVDCYVKGFPFATDKYTFKGGEKEVWHPSFVYHGFQYAEVSGGGSGKVSELTALEVHTDLRQKGEFICSDDLINWIVEAGNRSFVNNIHGISEDCPHREKNGWTGDAAVSCHHAVFRYDMKNFYLKWLADICDTQREDGQICCIVPTSGWGYNWGNGPAWDSALFFLADAYYVETGDDCCYRLVYDAAKKYLSYARTREREGLVCYGLGDWCPPAVKDLKIMSNELSDSCYYYKMLEIMARMAEVLGRKERDFYRQEADRVKRNIRAKYIKGETVDNDSIGAMAEVLYFRIVEGEQAEKIACKLNGAVCESGYGFYCGILGAKAVLNALTDFGYEKTALKMLQNEEYPSYGYWRKNGATTFWENWEADIGSRNHQMYSEVLNWVYRNILGIKNKGIGYDKCEISPCVFADRCFVRGGTETRDGKLSVEWEYVDGVFKAKIRIPENVHAVMRLNGKEICLKAGENNINFC